MIIDDVMIFNDDINGEFHDTWLRNRFYFGQGELGQLISADVHHDTRPTLRVGIIYSYRW